MLVPVNGESRKLPTGKCSLDICTVTEKANTTFFSAYPLASVGHAAWILRHYGYRAVFIWGLCLYAIGALLAIAALKKASFGGFCACIFIIGNGLGSLETAANPFITGMCLYSL